MNYFHSVGKPAYMFYVDDVDWVPSKNLTNTDQHDEQDHDFDSDLSRTCFAASFRKSSLLLLY